jgi:hypothetical protein
MPADTRGQTGENDDGQRHNVAITAARVQSAPADDTAATEESASSEDAAEKRQHGIEERG